MSQAAATEITSVVFTGRSGERFQFSACPFGTRFKALGGVYIITRRTFDDPTFCMKATQHPLAIGHTSDLADALITRAQWAKLVREREANCVCVLAVSDPVRRSEIEQDLIDGNGDFRTRLQCLYFLGDHSSASRASSASPKQQLKALA